MQSMATRAEWTVFGFAVGVPTLAMVIVAVDGSAQGALGLVFLALVGGALLALTTLGVAVCRSRSTSAHGERRGRY